MDGEGGWRGRGRRGERDQKCHFPRVAVLPWRMFGGAALWRNAATVVDVAFLAWPRSTFRVHFAHFYFKRQMTPSDSLPRPTAMASGTNGSSTPRPAPLSAAHVFFHPLPPAHAPAPGKEAHGRYMLTLPWSRVSGWGQPKIAPRGELSFDPLSGVLQYAVTCFEGMKVGTSLAAPMSSCD